MAKPAFALLAGALVVLCVEAISAVGLTLAEDRASGTVLDLYLDTHLATVDDAERLRFVTESFDPVLGWTLGRDRTIAQGKGARRWTLTVREDGARGGPRPDGQVAIATYGDSFTAGDQVNDADTWQSVLGQSIGAPVANFGVSGSGPYQALLRMERHLDEGRSAPVLILGIMEDGLARALNRYRPFYLPRTSFSLGFKPALTLVDGQVVELPMTWDGAADPRAAAITAAEHDAWAASMVRFRPPFSLQVMRAWMPAPPGVHELWSREEAQVIRWVVDRFVARAEAANAMPIVLWVPTGRTLGMGKTPSYRVMADLDVRQVDSAEVTDAPGMWSRPYQGHWSPEGHRAVANQVRAVVGPLLDGGSQTP